MTVGQRRFILLLIFISHLFAGALLSEAGIREPVREVGIVEVQVEEISDINQADHAAQLPAPVPAVATLLTSTSQTPAPTASTVQSRLPAETVATSSRPKRHRFPFPFFDCANRDSTLNAVICETEAKSAKIEQLKIAIDSDNLESLLILLDNVPIAWLYDKEEYWQSLNRLTVLEYCILKDRLEAFEIIFDHVCSELSALDRMMLKHDVLRRAVECGNVGFVRHLIEEYRVTITGELKLFHLAITYRVPVELLEYLSRRMTYSQINVASASFRDDTIWHTAIRLNNPEAFIFMFRSLRAPKCLSKPNRKHELPYNMLLEESKVPFLDAVLKEIPELVAFILDDANNCLVHVASRLNRITSLEIMAARAPQYISLVNKQGHTALITAIIYNVDEAARFLIKANVDPFIKDFEGFDALYYCLFSRGTTLVVDLLQEFYTRRSAMFSTVFHEALLSLLQRSRWAEAESVLSQFLSLAIFRIPLMIHDPVAFATMLIRSDYLSLFTYCLYSGLIVADLFIPSEGRRLLHFAVYAKNPLFITRLLEYGASANVFDVQRNTPFDLAMKTTNRAAMKAFLASGRIVVDHRCDPLKFRAYLLNGGTFVPNAPNQLRFVDFLQILSLFRDVLAVELRNSCHSQFEVGIYCMQLELFLAHYLMSLYLRNGFVLDSLRIINDQRRLLASRFVNFNHKFAAMVQAFSPHIRQMLLGHIGNLAAGPKILSDILIPAVDPDNLFMYTLIDYSRLFSH